MGYPEFVPTCETCRFAKINWRKGDSYEQGYTSGPSKTCQREHTSVQCRINPPTQGAFDGQSVGWPWVAGEDWCASFQPLEAWAAAQSQPAAEPKRAPHVIMTPDQAESLHKAQMASFTSIDPPFAESTPAREVPDSEVPDIALDKWNYSGIRIAEHLRSIGMAIVYREGPRHD